MYPDQSIHEIVASDSAWQFLLMVLDIIVHTSFSTIITIIGWFYLRSITIVMLNLLFLFQVLIPIFLLYFAIKIQVRDNHYNYLIMVITHIALVWVAILSVDNLIDNVSWLEYNHESILGNYLRQVSNWPVIWYLYTKQQYNEI